MANITDQFITSFSELYIRVGGFTDQNGDFRNATTGKSVKDVKPSTTNVKDWFGINEVAGKNKSTTLTITSAVTVAGNVVVTLGGVARTIAVTIAAATVVADDIRTALDAITDDNFTITGSGSSIVITGNQAAGDFTATYDNSGVTGGAGTFGSVVEFIAAVAETLRVPLVMEIGTLSNEATVIDTPTFGEVFKGKLRGQLDGGQLDAQLYWAPRDPVHALMRDLAQDGREVTVGIKWRPSSEEGSDAEYVVFNSFVSSFGIDTAFDDVAKASTTLVVDGAEHFAGDV